MSNSFSHKEQKKQAKQELINQKFKGSKGAYYGYYANYWFLMLILMAAKSGVLPMLVALVTYVLTFKWLSQKVGFNIWLSIFSAFIASILSAVAARFIALHIFTHYL